MLEIIEYGKDEYEFPALVVLGCFDAIHAGHRELLKKAKLQAKINGLDLGVMMFKEGKGGKLVYSFEERCAFLEQYNVKFVLAIDFNDDFKAIDAIDFLHSVEDKINVKAYMSGKDFRFGAKAKGKSSTLKNYAEDEENGVWYMPVKDVDLKGEKISTTLIKTCLDEGNVAKANELLGAEFSVSGEVVKGEGRGTSVVGFPTVNIVYPDWKYALKHGVYNVKCLVGDTDYQGIANFGNCPTFGDERVALEVYLEGFSGDLYGQILTIRFIDYIRDIEEFGSAEELSGQLQNDLLTVSDELVVAEDQPVETVEEVVEEEQPAEKAEETVAEEQPAETVEEVVEEEQPEEIFEEEGFDEIIDDGLDDTLEENSEETVTEEQEEPEQPVEEVVEEQTEESEQPAEEEVVEEQTEEPEQPVEEVVDEQIEETEQPVEEFVEEQTEEPEQPIEEVVEEQTEKPEQSTEEVIEEQEEIELPAEEIVEEQTEEPEQPVEEVVEEQTEEPEQSTEEVIEEQEEIELPAEEIVEEEQLAETVEEVIEEPTEEPEQPAETVEEIVGEEQSAETVEDVPNETDEIIDVVYTEGEESAVADEFAEDETEDADGDGEEN